MIHKLKNLTIALMITLAAGLVAVPAIANADLKNDACQGVNSLNGSDSSSCAASGANGSISRLVKNIIQILSIIVGFVAVVMVIVGGLKMITANGDSNAVASARSTIVYALIGVIIVVLAQVLVRFVIFNTKSAL